MTSSCLFVRASFFERFLHFMLTTHCLRLTLSLSRRFSHSIFPLMFIKTFHYIQCAWFFYPISIIRNTVKNRCANSSTGTQLPVYLHRKIDRSKRTKWKHKEPKLKEWTCSQKTSILMREPQRTQNNSNAVLFIHHLVIFTFCSNVTNTKPILLLLFSVVCAQVNTICTHVLSHFVATMQT